MFHVKRTSSSRCSSAASLRHETLRRGLESLASLLALTPVDRHPSTLDVMRIRLPCLVVSPPRSASSASDLVATLIGAAGI